MKKTIVFLLLFSGAVYGSAKTNDSDHTSTLIYMMCSLMATNQTTEVKVMTPTDVKVFISELSIQIDYFNIIMKEKENDNINERIKSLLKNQYGLEDTVAVLYQLTLIYSTARHIDNSTLSAKLDVLLERWAKHTQALCRFYETGLRTELEHRYSSH